MAYTEDQRIAALIQKTDSIRYQQPTLADVGGIEQDLPLQVFVPRVDPAHPFYTYWDSPFDLARYKYANPPIELGSSGFDETTLHSEIVNVLRMPLKFPGTTVRIPEELMWLKDFIFRMLRYETQFNNQLDECFIHITVDKSKVEQDTYHRYPGFHGDGVQGSKFSQKIHTPIEHSYIFVSDPGTEFCLQPYFVEHLRDSKHNIFHEFEKQSKPENIVKTLPWHIYLLDPYMVHRTPPITSTVDRIFVRLTIAFTELQHPKNTLNPLFEGTGKYEPRTDIRDLLSTYPGPIPWEMYGLSGPERSI